MHLEIRPVEKMSGAIEVPGDKSISHRAIMLASLSNGNTIIENFLESEDCLNTVDCFKAMGIEMDRIAPPGKNAKTAMWVKGRGLHGLSTPNKVLYVGNSGTTMRLILGILAGQDFHTMITGDESIKKRPMKRVVEPLRKMGAVIYGKDDGNYAPIEIKGGNLRGIEYNLPVASAQVKSCLMLASLFAKGETIITESYPSRDHTEKLFSYFGIPFKKNDNALILIGIDNFPADAGELFPDRHIIIPGDISSAAFFIVAALILPHTKLTIKNVGLNPTRTGIIDVLRRMGANIEIKDETILSGEERGNIIVKSSKLKGINISGNIIPRIIDEVPIIAVAAIFSEGETVISNAGELRVKESDRLKTITQELNNLGAEIKEVEDGLIIKGTQKLKGGTANSHGDHRIAMSCAIAGLASKTEVVVENTACIETSFPGFEKVLKGLIH